MSFTLQQHLNEISLKLNEWENEHYLDRSDGWVSADIPKLLRVIEKLIEQRDGWMHTEAFTDSKYDRAIETDNRALSAIFDEKTDKV